MGRGKRQATHRQQTGISRSSQLYSLLVNIVNSYQTALSLNPVNCTYLVDKGDKQYKDFKEFKHFKISQETSKYLF
jgi:4-alpha-glucanotransferase